MQPRFPLARSIWTALIVSVLAAAAVAVVARLTLPTASERTEPMGVVTTVGALSLGTTAVPGADSLAGEGAAVADAADIAVADAADDPAVAAADSSVALALVDSTRAAEATEPVAPVAGVSGGGASGGEASGGDASGGGASGGPAAILARLQACWQTISKAPERWIVLTTFLATFILTLLTALVVVRGSAPTEIVDGPVRRRSDAVQLLAVLQREGRLVDFLREEIESFTDAQIGAAVRTVHSGCRQALEEHVVLQPVSEEEEGASVIVEEGFDPSVTRLTGNVSGEPPFQGALRHRGWRATEVNLPTDAQGQDPEIVAPAEVEIP